MQIITHPDFLAHEVVDGHPERRARLSHLNQHLEACGITQDHALLHAEAAPPSAIAKAHPGPYYDNLIAKVPSQGIVYLDADTCMGAQSLRAATLAAGAVCQGVDDAIQKRQARSFCLVRPPGHHAEADAAMGFCLLNSIAIGAYHALSYDEIERVAILDFDVHHGNGTVDIFRDVPEVLVCSSFQHPFYPHRFYNNDWPNIINTPLRSGSGGYAFRKAIERDWLPALEAHRPDIVFISAGFDGHRDDPLAGLNLLEEDFQWVTELIVSMAQSHTQGRIVSALEGGYDLNALANSVEAHLLALA